MNAAARLHWTCLRPLACAMLLVLLPACQSNDRQPPSLSTSAASDSPTAAQEIWEAYFLKGAKIGYGHTLVRQLDRAGETLIETESLNHLKIERFGQSVEQDLKLATLETPTGQLLEFTTEAALGQAPTIVAGHVEGDEMVIATQTGGARRETRVPWTADVRGFRGTEQSLEARPLAAGEKRSLRVLVPLLNQVADVDLIAADVEPTDVMGTQQKLLRIDTVARMPDGNTMAEMLWTDKQGNVVKRRIEGIEQESHRTAKELAMADAPAGQTVDLGSDTIVKIDPPLENAHQTRQVRYRVELPTGDPAKTFAGGPTQSVRSLGPHVAELTVKSIRPGDSPGKADSKSDAAIAGKYTAANNVLQTGDERIKQMAAEARGSETDPIKIALALERYVNRIMSQSDFSQAFATAADVAQSRSGDCTEHAVLLAALARACGIPSRVAIGLVYVENAGGFGYHMWTEMYLNGENGQWIPLDATLGQGGIGAAHLKLIDSSLDDDTGYSAFLPVVQVVGQLKIEVLNAE